MTTYGLVYYCELALLLLWHRQLSVVISGNSQWRIYIVKFWTRPPPPPWGSKFFQFHAVFGKFWRNRMLAPPPPGELAPPPRGNPRSATDSGGIIKGKQLCLVFSGRLPSSKISWVHFNVQSPHICVRLYLGVYACVGDWLLALSLWLRAGLL